MFLGYSVVKHKDFNKFSFVLKFPLISLLRRYCSLGFFRIAKLGKQTRYVARRQDRFLFIKKDFFIIQCFFNIFRAMNFYYVNLDYKGSLGVFLLLLKKSAALTLAHRHQLKKASQAFTKWGS